MSLTLPLSLVAKPYTETPAKNVYYLAISATQKCIRRSQVEAAVNFAKVAWRADMAAAVKRIWTWWMEDCGTNFEAAKLLRKPFNTLPEFLHLVSVLASGVKNRDAAYSGCLLTNSGIRRDAFILLTNEGPRDFAQLVGHWPSEEFEVYSRIDLVRDSEDIRWVLTLCEQGAKKNRDGFAYGIPYFLADCGKAKLRPLVNEVSAKSLLYDDFLPLESVDCHTRPGAAAISAFTKRHEYDKTAMDNMSFYLEGWLLRDMSAHEFPFWKLSLKLYNLLEYCTPKAARTYHSTILPQLNDCRCWALKNTARNDVDHLKQLYLEDWITLCTS